MTNFGRIGTFGWIVGSLLAVSAAQARGYGSGMFQEDNDMVANGQGVSSPSFWDGISGANPAGLVRNMSIKAQGNIASFDDSTTTLRESGGLLAGNGTYGAGVEYSNFNLQPYGAAGTLETLGTTLGISGHAVSNGGGSTYDVGTLIDLFPRFRLGGVIPNFTNGLQTVAAGFTYIADPMVDFVVDAGYQLRYQQGIVKPGISLHTNMIHATASYGFRFAGTWDSVFVTTKFTAAVGLRLTERFLVEYEYRELPEHRLGLTIRFN